MSALELSSVGSFHSLDSIDLCVFCVELLSNGHVSCVSVSFGVSGYLMHWQSPVKRILADPAAVTTQCDGFELRNMLALPRQAVVFGRRRETTGHWQPEKVQEFQL